MYFLLSDGESPRLFKNTDLDRKYNGYPDIPDSLFTKILILFLLMLMCPVDIFFKSDHQINTENFVNLKEQITISGH